MIGPVFVLDEETPRLIDGGPQEARPQNGPPVPSPVPPGAAPRPPLNRIDSRSNLLPQSTRPVAPLAPQLQQRPQFQPGGPVTNPPQLTRPVAPTPRGPVPSVPAPTNQPQQQRPQAPPQRPPGPQSIVSPQGVRPQGPPGPNQFPRVTPPNNLQFGPRQQPHFGAPTTPDASKAPGLIQGNENSKNIQPSGPKPQENSRPGSALGSFPRQPSQGSLKGLDILNLNINKQVNLENQNANNERETTNKSENGIEIPGAAKSRSYSIAAAPGAPSPLKMDDDRRKSISAIGGKIDELSMRSSGLGLIQESKDASVRGSKDSMKSEASIENVRDIQDRPESRLSGSKMSESFIGSFSNIGIKKQDDDDDVVLQNNVNIAKSNGKTDISDRSPSLTRSDDSSESKQTKPLSNIPSSKTSPQPSSTPEPQRPKTPAKPNINTNCVDKDLKVSTPNSNTARSPAPDTKPPTPMKKPNELNTSATIGDTKKSTPRKATSASKERQKDGDNDSGVDESTQGNDVNGSPGSPSKKSPSKLPTKQSSSHSLKQSLSRSSSKSATAKTPENPLPVDKKKVPMNKVQVGNAPSPNIKTVKSKIGSLDNATYKPGGGRIKIENKKLDFQNVTPKIEAKNDKYMPSGGSKKILSTKLEWNAKSKVGSLQNASYKPGGGDKKIETVKLDFKEKAKPKVASTANITHKPGGGAIKIENQKLEFKAQSKVGSLDNVKHRPGGGEVKIFDDKDYIKQVGAHSPALSHSGQEVSPPPRRTHAFGYSFVYFNFTPCRCPLRPDHYYVSMQEWEERSQMRCRSARAPRTPRALSPRRRRLSARALSARDPPPAACARPASAMGQRPAFSVY
ncbi:Microtubule-associated protein 2 [Eumeta japonica]|uniref:Microtubule-associated protein n=1 Tax=Eumeta variegata TaxID=151549 RepID=A0A4C1UJB1_EUMVA|nr:Microtubule-associated protein 2 [Eumeta japonica]